MRCGAERCGRLVCRQRFDLQHMATALQRDGAVNGGNELEECGRKKEACAGPAGSSIWRQKGSRIMNSLNVEQIQEIIPHRHPFLLLDKIEDYEPGQYAVGYKAVTYREDFFRGHFPQKAVMPGVLILEALAQTGAVAILSMPENKGKIAFFGGVQKCRFKGMVFPGDTLKLETKIIKSKGPVGVGQATAYVDGKVVVSAELTFMVGE